MTDSAAIVRARTEAECASVLPLVEAHARFEQNPVTVPEDWAVRTADLIASDRLHLFIAVASETPIGYATLTEDLSTWTAAPYGHLDCLFIDAAYREIGRAHV